MTQGLGMDASGVWYDDVALGDTFSRSITITDTHLVLGAGRPVSPGAPISCSQAACVRCPRQASRVRARIRRRDPGRDR